jgi:hypothetical protein
LPVNLKRGLGKGILADYLAILEMHHVDAAPSLGLSPVSFLA